MKASTPENNLLAAERSPYLAQHADNPVAWQPWGEEAFEAARRADVPVFLSIGYSTCHWCHVMAHESFEDPLIAELLNRHFVCIKVDREERPDIDAVYMRFCQLLTGSGGWPLTIIMTPDKEPFFAATYIPPRSTGGRTGMFELIPRIAHTWQHRRGDIMNSVRDSMAALQQPREHTAAEITDRDLLDRAFAGLRCSYDRSNGGFGHAPKFPSPHTILFLLRYWKLTGSDEALAMATHTLSAMRLGGICDHIGYGFHRYTTDPAWFLPHFEKMLYDQAMLLWTYTEAYQATGAAQFAETAREIGAFVLRDLTAPDGGFYCALDADSDGEEGTFYQWAYSELETLLTPDELQLARELCGVLPRGNAYDEATGNVTGLNVIHLTCSLLDHARHSGHDLKDITARFNRMRARLFEARMLRNPPHRDEKILTDWNGLMIGALALAGRVLGQESFITEARRAAERIMTDVYRSCSGLQHCCWSGEPGITALADDYSFLIWGLMELYQATFSEHYLLRAIELQSELEAHYTDERTGVFFSTHADANDLPIRPLEIHDGALPSGNSMAMLNLLRLGSITGRADYDERACRIAETLSAQISRMPESCCMLMCALLFKNGPRTTVVIAGTTGAADTRRLQQTLNRLFLPDACILFHPAGHHSTALAAHMPGGSLHPPVSGRAAAYVCRDNSCLPPICKAADLKRILQD